jgi:hypothetical protein
VRSTQNEIEQLRNEYERRQTDMKEKFTKPEITVLMKVVIINPDEDKNNGIYVVGNDDDIEIGTSEGENEDW